MLGEAAMIQVVVPNSDQSFGSLQHLDFLRLSRSFWFAPGRFFSLFSPEIFFSLVSVFFPSFSHFYIHEEKLYH